VQARRFRRWQSRGYVLLTAEHVRGEVDEAFAKRYFRRTMTPDAILGATGLLRRRGEIVPLSGAVVGAAGHPHDDPVLETAIAGGADYLVTGDAELLTLGSYQSVVILTPREFLAVLDLEAAQQKDSSS